MREQALLIMVVITMDKQYKDTIEQIRIDSESYTDAQMQDVYKEQNNKLDELLQFISLIFITYAVKGLLNLTSFQKNTVLQSIKLKLSQIGKDLGQNEVDKVTNILEEVYKDTYIKTAYVMDGFGISVNKDFSILKKEFVDQAVNRVYKGELFSDRIWKNKAKLVDRLYKYMNEATQGKMTIDEIAKSIKNEFSVTAYESKRLVHTEMARNATDASIQVAINSDCEYLMFNATLDRRTAPLDASYDGKVWKINDSSKPKIPLHPNCRCVWLPMINKDWKPSKRLDNKSKQLIDYQDYAAWLKNKGINDSTTD
jgi:SPP1 gp7 family putative phage head morphogenesis protein